MIERYSRAVMRNIWTEENKFNAYLEVEILAAEAWSTLGVIPAEDVQLLREKATFNIDRIHEIEEITRHDIVAFTRTVSESLGEEKKWVHYGLTSTDIVDTANGYLLKQANEVLRKDLHSFLEVLKRRANELSMILAGIADEIGQECVGQTIRVLVDSPGIARGPWDAPDVDGTIHVDPTLPVGEFADVEIVDSIAYELFAEGAEEPAEMDDELGADVSSEQ